MSLLFKSLTITLQAALRDVVNGSSSAKVAAAHALGDVADTDRATAGRALLLACNDMEPAVRAECMASLASLYGSANQPDADSAMTDEVRVAIEKRLMDGSALVRQHAAIGLGRLGNPKAFAALVDVLQQGPADVRFQAVTSMAELAPELAYEPLVAALDDRDAEVISAAALGLGAIGDGRAVAHLAAHLDHVNAAVMFDVAYALARHADGRGRARLIAALLEPERAWDAVAALAMLHTDADFTSLASVLSDKRVSDEVKLAAAGALHRFEYTAALPAARDCLQRGLDARKEHLRGIAIEQIALRLDAWSLEQLRAMRSTRKGRVFVDLIDEVLLRQ
jgi:HEAT repeat protein